MSKSFLINNTVLYFPETHCLALRSDPTVVAHLHVPASRCLLLLIERKGEIISQREFFEKVWESNGTYVTANTFYQSISHLRKGLKTVGLTGDVIKSLSKQGMTLSAETTIVEYDESQPILLEIPDEKTTESQPRRFPYWKTSAFIALAIIILSSIVLYSSSSPRESQSLLRYKPLTQKNGCNFMAPESKRMTERYLSFIKDNEIPCGTGEFAYLNMPNNIPRVSVFICDGDINLSTTHCTTHYFPGGNDAQS
ncbi:winged helix-turn-helix domain-containing protein [Serratia fonticola]|uniref:winged helix-turn-helix domain-containing protein n=1 Tax=Serratia fonticola TaxID=47917 RepID=UPI00192D1C27|nr:winged helix-turn-helix domain-containing protein [Serratia fonticola]MBL5825943.1 winged helix-turn-helix domain-containing protein [Serratia fonticola]